MTHSETPYRHWIVDGWIKPVGWEHLPGMMWEEWEVGYANDVERSKRTTRVVPEGYEHVFAKLRSAETVEKWIEHTGIRDLADDPTMHGGGLHVMGNDSWLQGHVDYQLHPKLPGRERRLNLIAFVHPTWRPQYGGRLLLMNSTGQTVTAIDPLPGRLVVFETGDASYHGVQRVAGDAPPRVSAAVYYHSPAREGASRTRALFFPNRNSPRCLAEVA